MASEGDEAEALNWLERMLADGTDPREALARAHEKITTLRAELKAEHARYVEYSTAWGDVARGQAALKLAEDAFAARFASVVTLEADLARERERAQAAEAKLAVIQEQGVRCSTCRRLLPDGHPGGYCPARDDPGYF
jgi:hypothetical protein